MKSFYLLIIFALISGRQDPKSECDYISNYYQKIYRADLAYRLKNYTKAFELYQEAFNSCKPINTESYNEISSFAELCAILGKNDLAIEFVRKQIDRGYDLSYLSKNENFDNVFASDQGKKLLADYDSLRSTALSKLNLSLREELKQMQIEDQRYRNENYKDNIQKQRAIDEYNTQRLIEIFDEYGFPNEAVIGSYLVDRTRVNISVMLLHTEDSIRMHYFVPKLKEYVKNGECSPYTLGTVIDQYYLYNGEPQIHGTYSKRGGGYAKMISDLGKVDSNRIAIGLPPLELKEKKDSLLQLRYNFKH